MQPLLFPHFPLHITVVHSELYFSFSDCVSAEEVGRNNRTGSSLECVFAKKCVFAKTCFEAAPPVFEDVTHKQTGCAKLSGTRVPTPEWDFASMPLVCELRRLRNGRHKDSIKSIIGRVISWAFLMRLF